MAMPRHTTHVLVVLLMAVCLVGPGAETAGLGPRELAHQLRFRDAHRHLVQGLEAGRPQAQLDLAWTLLAEMKWARHVIAGKLPATAAENNAFKREQPYAVIVRTGSGEYIAGALTREGPSYVTGLSWSILEAWRQVDYLRLVVSELQDYLRAPRTTANDRRMAAQWLEVLQPIAGESEYLPYTSGYPSAEILVVRLKEAVAVAEAIDEGRLLVADLRQGRAAKSSAAEQSG